MLGSSLHKKILMLTSGLGIAQLILIVGTPWITRLYAPDIFAYFGYIVSVAAVLLPLASLHYEYAIPQMKTKKMISLIRSLCARLVFITSSITLVTLVVLNIHFHYLHATISTLSLCFFVFLLQGILQIYSLSLISAGKPLAIARGKLIQNCGMLTVQILLAYAGKNSAESLLFGLMIGLLLNFLYLKITEFPAELNILIPRTKKTVSLFLRRYHKLPLFSSWASFIEATATAMPVLLIGPLYGAKFSGLYFLIFRVFTAPTSLLINATSQVMIKEFSDRIKMQKKLCPLFLKLTMVLAATGFCYALFLIFLSHYTHLIFGAQWIDTAPTLKLLAPVIGIMLCVSPLSSLFLLINRNGTDFLWQLSYLSLTFILIYSCHQLNFLQMLFYLVVLWVFLYLTYWLILFKAILTRDVNICAA